MVCPNCGREVKSGAHFCGKCGFDLSTIKQEQKYEQNDSKKIFNFQSDGAFHGEKKDNVCSICGQNIATKKLADGYICSSCMERTFDQSPRWRKMTITMVEDSIFLQQRMDERRVVFTSTDGVVPFLEIDKMNHLICANGNSFIAWEDVIDFQLLEDGNVIRRGGFGGALIGGALFGGAGAIIGHSARSKSVKTAEELAVKIVTRDELLPQIRIDLIHGSVKTDTRAYKRAAEAAQKVLTLLTIVTDSVQNASTIDSAPDGGQGSSAADEIKKYKELMDEGILTPEEFDEKKKQLLGL